MVISFNNDDKVPKLHVMLAMVCITVLVVVAVCQGVDGVLLGAGLAALAGLAGLIMPQLQMK